MANLGGEFVVRGLVILDSPAGKAWGINQANCNIHTKIMMLDPVDDNPNTLEMLRFQLLEKLGKNPAGA